MRIFCLLALAGLGLLPIACHDDGSCRTSADCGRAQRCVAGECVLVCNNDRECFTGQICQRGLCVDRDAAEPAPSCWISGPTLDLGATATGFHLATHLMIQNLPLDARSSLEGHLHFDCTGTGFSVAGEVSGSQPFALAAGESSTIPVGFTAPETRGPQSCDVAVSDNVPAQEHHRYRLNSGIDEDRPVPGWDYAIAYTRPNAEGESYNFREHYAGSIDLTPELPLAPEQVYWTCRHWDHSYDIPVPDGRYLVRLHFFDNQCDRSMTYLIEDHPVLEDFTPCTSDQTTRPALVREFEVSVTDGDGLQIDAVRDQGNDAFEAGIEVYSTAVPCSSVTLRAEVLP